MDSKDRLHSAAALFRRIRLPLAAALICLVLAFLCGLSLEEDPFRLTYQVPQGVRNFASAILANAALAIAIAAVATEVAERAAQIRLERERHFFEEQAKTITEASSRAVARNVWGADYAENVLEESLATTFSSHLLREDHLHELIFDPIADAPRAVAIKQRIEYTLVNPSRAAQPFDPVFSFDDTLKLYPNDRHLQRPTFTGIKIGPEAFTGEHIGALNAQLYPKDNADLSTPGVALGNYTVPPNGKLRVRITWESVEPIDSHWLNRVFRPTKGAYVLVRNNLGPSFVVYLIALFRGDFGPRDDIAPDGSEWERRHEGVILPQSGWIVRWNRLGPPEPAAFETS